MIDRIKRFANRSRFCRYMVNVFFLIYSYMCSFICICFRIFPLQKNKVVCCCLKGKRYGDNPQNISSELLKRNSDYKIIWLLQTSVNEELPTDITRVNYNVLSLLYHLSTAEIWIDCNMKPYGVLKRKGQLYIQTWHGSYGLKKIGKDLGNKISFIDNLTMQYNSKIADLYISNSKRTSEIYRRAFWYSGNILECGSPRNDIFFEDSAPYIKKVQEYFGLQGKRIGLYAPTYRADFSTQSFQLDYYRLKHTLEKRFGGEWVILVRLHPQNIMDADSFFKYDECVINATPYSIMQELLVACDVLITDYSSCMFDFVTKGKLCFLYATDIDKYKQERDYYFELEDLPFPLATNDAELEKAILSYDEKQYTKDLQKLFENVGLCESGEASKRVVDYIEQWRKDK